MTTGSDLLQILAESAGPGQTSEPKALLSELAKLDNPFAALSDHDQGQNLFASFSGEFGYFPGIGAGRPLQPHERSRWACLVRWLISELNHWTSQNDIADQKLAAIMIVAQCIDSENVLWPAIPVDVSRNEGLIGRLAGIVRSCSITFSAPEGIGVPIWEREAVEKFKFADAQGNWAEIGGSLRLFERQIFSRVVLSQPVRCLCRCGMVFLVEAVANIRQTLAAIEIANALPTAHRLALAIASDNSYIQFGCTYQTCNSRLIRTPQGLSTQEQATLADLLVKVSQDGSKWRAWMRVFNAYPGQYPRLQASLGQALAAVPEDAVRAYVDAPILIATQAGQSLGRAQVAECLREFRTKADPSRRALLWKLAQKRCSVWNFEEADSNKHLIGINWSVLDYARVAFACECMKEADRLAAMKTTRDELQAIDDCWHASLSDLVTAWHRLLSRCQPYAHAIKVSADGDDWLYDKIYLPFDTSTNDFLRRKYRMADLTPAE
jgi:hypothetical protein